MSGGPGPSHVKLLGGSTQPFEIAQHRSVLRAVPHTWYPSILDQILRAPPPKPNFHPVHATKFVRRFVLAKMTLFVDICLRQTYSLTLKAIQKCHVLGRYTTRTKVTPPMHSTPGSLYTRKENIKDSRLRPATTWREAMAGRVETRVLQPTLGAPRKHRAPGGSTW